MKKKAISFLTAFLTAISCTATMLPTITRTAIAASTSNVKFDEDEFYVAVGTCKGATQLRYFAQKSDGSYTVEKVVWEDAPADISYGDVFIGDGNIEMTKVMAAPDNPVYAMAYYYQLDNGAKLNKVGKCDDFMEKKVLTVSSKTYDGSAHWSIRYKDSGGKEYYYGLSNFASTLTVDPLDCEVGDVYTYALCNDYMVIPLAKENDISDVYAEPEYKIVKLPDKVEYKLGEQIDLKGIEIEVTKDKKEPVVYTYPDVAFDYQSNIPKSPSVVLSTDFRNDKAGTYKIEVVGADNVCFDVKVVDDSTIKDIGVFEEGTKPMALDDVKELAKKGGELTWSDFEAYSGRKCGTPFDMLAYIYEIDESYYLFVSGAVDGAPDKVQLCHYNEHISVDVLTGDVEAFIAEYSNYELPDIGYTFDEIYNMTEDEVRTVFNEKGLTDTEKYHVYPQRNGNTAVDNDSMTILLYPENYMLNLTDHELVSHVTDMNDRDKLFKDSDIVWDSEKVRKSLGLPKEYFYFEDVSSMGVTKSAPEGEDPDIRKYCQCSIRCTSEDKDKIADLRRAALNYIQLNPDFALVYPETYGGENVLTPEKNLKGDANCDGQVDLADAVMIMQALANPNKYGLDGTAEHHLTEQGKLNSDMDGDGLTVGDALAIQRKLLGLDIAVAQSIDSSLIANKVFTYEKSADPGIYDDLCDLSFGSNGTYVYHIGYYTSSNQDQGTWEISGDTLVLTGQYGTNKFRYEDKALIYIAEESDGFSEFNDKSTPKDGEKFILAPERTYDVQTKSMNDVTVSIKSDLRPHMSDLSGIGILLDVKSNDYPVTLKATDGNFVEWDIEKGSGPVKTVGKEYDIGKNGYIFWNPDKLYYQDGFESEIQVIGVSGDVFIDVGKIYVSQVKGGIFEASFEKPSPSASTDNSVIAGKIFAYEKEGAGGYCTLSFNENGRFLYSPGKLSSYMGGGDWKIDGDTVSLIGMVDKTIYLKITDDTLVYIAEGSDEFPYMDIKDGEKFGIYRPEISSDYFQLNSRYSEYGLGNPKVELDLIAGELPEFCYVENVKLYDENDNFIGTMSPAMDADIWSYLVDCHVTEECSKTFYTLTKVRCGEKTYLDDVRSEITVNFKDTPAP